MIIDFICYNIAYFILIYSLFSLFILRFNNSQILIKYKMIFISFIFMMLSFIYMLLISNIYINKIYNETLKSIDNELNLRSFIINDTYIDYGTKKRIEHIKDMNINEKIELWNYMEDANKDNKISYIEYYNILGKLDSFTYKNVYKDLTKNE